SPLLRRLHYTSPTALYTLSLHDALPISFPASWISKAPAMADSVWAELGLAWLYRSLLKIFQAFFPSIPVIQAAVIIRSADILARSEEHTSELQSRFDLVCRLLLEKKNSQ